MFGWRLYHNDDLQDWQDRVSGNAAKEAYFQAMQEVLAIAEKVPAASDDLKPIIDSSGAKSVVWIVPRNGQEPIYVRADRATKADLSKRWIVFVKAREFYAWWRWSGLYVWRISHFPEDNHFRPPSISKITEYYKYDEQNHWQEGLENPSELPRVAFRPDGGLNFADGMTRTMWLVVNGAAIFPVEADNGEDEAVLLHRQVGYAQVPPAPLSKLIRP